MKWFLVFLIVVASLTMAVIGVIACADPEGRGVKIASILFGGSLMGLALATSLSFFWWV